MKPNSRLFGVAIAASTALHAAVLAIGLLPPERAPARRAAPLEVFLVSAASRSRPKEVDVLAVASTDGGADQNRIAFKGDPLDQAQQRVAQLEALQQHLLTQLETRPGAPVVPAAGMLAVVQSGQTPPPVEASAVGKGPRKVHVGMRAAEYRFSRYVDDWRRRIERIGNLHYPDAARGKLYGSLRLAVSIRADGSLAGLELERSSGHPVLDRAAERYVRMGAPYPRFSSELSGDVDVLVITQTWHFETSDRMLGD